MDNANERRFREVAIPRIDARLAQLEAENKQLREALSLRPADPAWISASERLPVTGSLCWIVWAGTVQTMAYRRFGLGFACADGYAWEDEYGQGDSIPDAEVTHWQPLPAPPLASPVPPKEQK